MIAYHASNKKFDKFSMDYANTREHKEQFNALWFSTDKDYIKQFGNILYKVEINGNFLKENQYRKIDKLVHEFDSECDDGIGILETNRGQEFSEFLKEKGIDGYIFPQNDGKTIICFNPECCKIIGTLNEEEYKYVDNTEILKLSPNDDLKVYRNFAKDFETLRALIVGEDIYLWDAKQLTHDQMADEIFGEDYEIYNQFMFDTRYKQLDDYSVRNTIDMVEFDKGTELAKQWYNDFFKYYKIIKDRLGVDFSKEGLEKVEQLKSMNPNVITERLEELEQGIYATQSAYDILNWLKNKPAPYRVVYDKNIRMYFICNSYDYIHQDMLEAAYRSGFYPEMYSVGDVQDYIYDTIDNEELLFFAFSPDADKVLDKEKSSDGYTQKYTYDFGAIYAHETTPLEDFDFYQLVGKPIKKDFIYEDFKSLNEKLQEFLS